MEKTQKAKIMKKDVIWNELIIYDFFGLPFFYRYVIFVSKE